MMTLSFGTTMMSLILGAMTMPSGKADALKSPVSRQGGITG
jgi:hypothetical protein